MSKPESEAILFDPEPWILGVFTVSVTLGCLTRRWVPLVALVVLAVVGVIWLKHNVICFSNGSGPERPDPN